MQIGLVVVIASAPLAMAQTTIGDYDCGQWVNNKGPASKSWLLGYLTGLNMMAADLKSNPKRDHLDKLNSADQAYLWMDNYCRANPLKRVSQGATALYIELMLK